MGDFCHRGPGFPAASPDSFEAVKQIADSLNDTAVTALARCVISDIDKAG